MRKFVAYAVIICAACVLLAFVDPNERLFDVLLGLAIGFTIPLVDAALINSTKLRMAWYSVRYARKTVRVSVSYLYRIKHAGKYLLVRSHRWPQYGPVGGVYKITPTAASLLDRIEALNDDLVRVDEISEHDLRLHIPGKNIYRFYAWFSSGADRETSPWREFYEELVSPAIVKPDLFPYVYHRYIRRVVRPMRYSSYARSDELLIADTYELLPTPEQIENLAALQKETSTDAIYWATADEIKRRGAQPGKNQTLKIGEPAEWTL